MTEPSDPTTPASGGDRISVVIVAYNNADTIQHSVRAAQAIATCTEIVVVDNGSDNAAHAAEAAGAVALRRPDNPGFGTSQNLGVRHTDCPFLLLLNPDADPDPEGIARGVAVLEAQSDVAAVQGVITSRRTGQPERSMGPDLNWRHLWGRALGLRRLLSTRAGQRLARLAGVGDTVDRIPSRATDVETLAATALLVRRAAFEEVGGFDESYFLYGEDLDLCRRLRRASWHLIGLPVPWATHDDGSTANSEYDRELSWWEGTMRYAAQWWSRPALSAAVIACTPTAIRLILRQPRRWKEPPRLLIGEPMRVRLARTSAWPVAREHN